MGLSLLCTSMNQGAQSPWPAVDRRCGSPCHKHRKPASLNPPLVAWMLLKETHIPQSLCKHQYKYSEASAKFRMHLAENKNENTFYLRIK